MTEIDDLEFDLYELFSDPEGRTDFAIELKSGVNGDEEPPSFIYLDDDYIFQLVDIEDEDPGVFDLTIVGTDTTLIPTKISFTLTIGSKFSFFIINLYSL